MPDVDFNQQPVRLYWPRSPANEAFVRRLIEAGFSVDCALSVDRRHDGSPAYVENDVRATIINGQLLQGPNGISGEWGHNPLPWRSATDGEPRRCYCGKQDCIETFLSGPGWVARSGLQGDARSLMQRAADSLMGDLGD